MKKLILSIFICFNLLFVSSCGMINTEYTVNTANSISTLILLKSQYQYAVTIIQNNIHKFNDSEKAALYDVQASVAVLIEDLEKVTKLNSVVSINDIRFMWDLAVKSYTSARPVVLAHFNDFTPIEQNVLRSFDNQATVTNEMITNLLNDPTTENINQAVTLVTTLATLATHIVALL